MLRKNRLLSEKYHLFMVFTTLIFASGCAHSPLFQEWDLAIRPKEGTLNRDFEKSRLSINAQLEAIEKENPSWKGAYDEDTQIVEYTDKNGKKIGSAEIRK